MATVKTTLNVGESATILTDTIHRHQVGQDETVVKLTFIPLPQLRACYEDHPRRPEKMAHTRS